MFYRKPDTFFYFIFLSASNRMDLMHFEGMNVYQKKNLAHYIYSKQNLLFETLERSKSHLR